MHAQQLAVAHAAATGAAMGPPGLPAGLGGPHPGMPPTSLSLSLPPGLPASSLAAGMLPMPNPLASLPPGFLPPLPPGIKDEKPTNSLNSINSNDMVSRQFQ